MKNFKTTKTCDSCRYCITENKERTYVCGYIMRQVNVKVCEKNEYYQEKTK